MKQLQAESFSPLYHQLMQRIRGDIERGVYPTGSRIPPEHELEKLYQVSRVTVRRALSELTSEGLLERKQGKGTFVATPRGAGAAGYWKSSGSAGRTAYRWCWKGTISPWLMPGCRIRT